MTKLFAKSFLVASSALALVTMTQANAVENTSSDTEASTSQQTPFTPKQSQRGPFFGDHAPHDGQGYDRGDCDAKNDKRRHDKGRDSRADKRGDPMAALDLSDEQRQQINAIIEAQRNERMSKREAQNAEREQQRQQIQALMDNDTLDSEALEALAENAAEQAKARFIDKVEAQYDMAQVLTDDQRDQLDHWRDTQQPR